MSSDAASSPKPPRRVSLQIGQDGIPEYRDTLTSPDLADPKNLLWQRPRPVIPVIMLPGIMATRLVNLGGDFVWNPPDPNDVGALLDAFCEYLFKGPKGRSRELNPATTMVAGPPPNTEAFFLERGRSALYASAYHKFMDFIEDKLNSLSSIREQAAKGNNSSGHDLQPNEEKASRFHYEFWGGGYNWLQSNADSAKRVKTIIEGVLAFYDKAQCLNKEKKVVLVTHSMGGLVARSLCTDKGFAKEKILGVVHIAQPAAGAAATYKRMRAGFEGKESVVLGRNAREVTAILSRAQGGLELLPFAEYNDGKAWLICPKEIHREPGTTPLLRLPREKDPYGDIYTSEEWYGLVPKHNLGILEITHGKEAPREQFNKFIVRVKKFHETISSCYHPCTYALWARENSEALKAWGTIIWAHGPNLNHPNYPDKPLPGMGGYTPPRENDDHLGTVTNQYYRAKLQGRESAGDGTVPADASAGVVEGKPGVKEVLVYGGTGLESHSRNLPKPEDDDNMETGFEHAEV